MSILIKGMSIPASCGFCPLRHTTDDGDECYVGAESTEYQKRPDDCPLVYVQPHGRLTDADAIKTTWMILEGLGYRKNENPKLEQAVREVFASAPSIEVE